MSQDYPREAGRIKEKVDVTFSPPTFSPLHNLNDLIDPSLGWRISLAHDINIAGQITVTGSTAPSLGSTRCS
jgi:hypothetical protein